MSYTKFATHYDWATGDELTAQRLNYNADGPQAEFEDRMEAADLNGVVSGFASSISGTSIALATGEAYCEGKRYAGSGTVAFVGASADTYYVYIDPTDDTTPYKKKTTVPSTGELTLCSVVWSGSALSGLVDLSQWGLRHWELADCNLGSVLTGIVGYYIIPHDVWCKGIEISVRSKPTGSSIIMDMHAGAGGATPSTVFTTTAYRPTITTSGTAYTIYGNSGYIEVNRKLAAGSIIEVYVDQTDSSSAAADLAWSIWGRYYGTES